MEYLKIFFVNTAVLITIAYLANLLYKHLITYASKRVKQISWVFLAIFAGWISSFFGYRLDEHVIFDLRFVPIIITTIAFPQPFSLMLIGFGTGLTRLTFGWNEAALAGMLNLSILGFLCAGISFWITRSKASIIKKGFSVILAVNVMNALNITIFGVIPATEYITEIMPITFPSGLLLSILFALIIWDFQLELSRNEQIRCANELLSAQTEELHKNEIVLEERAKQLMLASQYKSEFLANMSHELRTPLNSIINLSQLIEENDNSTTGEEIAEYGGIIHRSGEELLTLINDILDLSKVEAGRLDIIKEQVNVSEIPELLTLQFSVIAKQKELEFVVSVSENLMPTIISDPQRVQQILRNLLSNAFKFTQMGSVMLSIRAEQRWEDGQDLNWMVFEVRDSGIGIAEEKRVIIFEAFRQADGTISRKYGGTGLGLSISHDLARLLGGFITVQSEEGKGSIFSLYLPI
ncbi:histidine kinase [Bacillus sp. FJAT-27264]|uniref:sensor histidine kinase n=1 Tax=Paenibacillus sp. (strain DSM 101736 / FJAT-27264) TaxID=1850362 RepID=UPI000807C555|nr:ATP-binding protein [Bacillus sp. FJAT-27264]OBZ10517.1 histidine kinase [Bacillus sp. FJAT-27264]